MPQEKLNGGNGEKKIFKAAVVDADQLVAGQARDIGDAKMSESKDQLGQNRIRKFARRIWQQNLMEGYYRNREIQKARKDIIENKNLYHGEAEIANQAQNTNLHKESMDAIVERFTSEYENEMLRQEERDSREKAGAPLNTAIKDLIKKYAATPTMDKAAFEEEKKRIIRTHNPEYAKEDSLYADNLFDIANEVKQAVAQGEKLDQMDFEVNLTFGKARESLNTEGKKTTLDKLFGDNKFGKAIAQNAILSGAVAGAYSITKSLTMNYGKRAAKWFGFGAGLAAGAVVEGVKENARVNRERSQNMRENAKGMKFTDPDMERREEMAKNLYETKNATAIISELDGDLSLMKAGNVSEADMQSAFGRISELEARIRLGDAQKIDLISYDHYGSVEKDRMKIALRLAEIKVAIRKETASNPKAFMNGASYDDFIEGRTAHQENLFSKGDIAAKDKIFSQLKTRRIIRKMGQTVLMGAAMSFAAQELWALGTSRDGVIEGGAKSIYNHFSDESNHGADLHKNATALEALRRNLFGESPRMPTEHMHEAIMGATHIELPDGADIIDNGNGTYDFVRDGVVISNDIPLSFDSNGNLSPESIALLNKDDIYTDFYKIHDPEGKIDGNGAKNPSEWVEQHKDSMHRIHRHFMGNNTPMVDNPDYPGDPRHRFGSDLNELRADWGGVNNTGVTENGDYAFNVHRMTDDGSFQGDSSVAAHKQMLDGNLKMLLSVSKDSQQYVFEVDVDKYGNAIVDKNSEIGKMLFTTDASGHAVYTGVYAEIAHMNADVTYPDGGQDMDILATHIGDDAAKIPHDDVPYVTFDLPDDTDYDPPYPIPIVPRRPLERGEYGEAKKGDKDGKILDPERPMPYGYNEKLKSYYTDLKKFRNNEANIKKLEERISADPVLKAKYSHVLKNLGKLRNFEFLTGKDKAEIDRRHRFYNKRYSSKKPIALSEFVALEIGRVNRQIENVILEESKVGEKPFDKKFYEKSPLIKGLNDCKEVVIVLDDPVGDSVLMVPAINSLQLYFKNNGINKEIRIVSKQKKLLSSLENQLGGNVKIYDLKEAQDYFSKNNVSDRFVLNTNKTLDDYSMFGISKTDSKDLSKVMSVDWASWTKEEYPGEPGKLTKYDMMPARVARNFELMLGQKLYENINEVDNFIDKGPKFDSESKEIKTKYNIKDGEKIFTISAGSSVTPKEYEPDKWRKVIEGIIAKNPSAHILFLDDPDTARREKYGKMVDSLSSSGVNISRANEGMDKMNTIMSMSDYVLTPDTGLGHYAGALGKPTVMLFLSDPVLWSTPGAIRAMHPKAYETYKRGSGSYDRAWDKDSRDSYFVKDGGVLVGMSDLDPEVIVNKINKEEIKKGEPKTAKKKKVVKKTTKSKTEAKGTKSEKMTQAEFSNEMEKAFKDILSKEDNATIEKFSVNFEGDRIVGHTELKAKNSLGGKPVIDLDIMSDGKDFVFNKKGNKIRANSLARGSVNEAVAGIPDKIKEVLEKKYKQKIDSISIEGGEIKLNFE